MLALSDVTARMTQGELSSRASIKSRDEFGQLARSFNEMASRVEETVGTLRSFVADAAHELHTPLTALQTNLEQSQQLEALVKSLLDLSRIEAGESKLDMMPINFSKLIREMSEQFASRAEQTDHGFETRLIEGNVPVTGNQDQLRQVIVNLLENALKFTPVNGLISVTFDVADNKAKLTVADTGIGIPVEDLPYLFEHFHRGRNVSSYAGNGLGLAIVKAIMTAHRGTVHAQSEA